MLAVNLRPVERTYPVLGLRGPFTAVFTEVCLPLSVAPAIQVSPPQREGE